MSATADHFTASDQGPAAVRRDSLAGSVVFLIALSCVQPFVTLARGLVFCRWLDPDQLGCWDMAISFLTLIAPVVVLGIPGSFGRYVEHYSQRGQLTIFLRRTGWVCLIVGIVAVAFVAWQSSAFSTVIFGRGDMTGLVRLVALCLASVVLFGYMVELLTALRLFRVVSLLHFVKGVLFTLLGAGLLLGWIRGPESIVLAYASACFLATVLAMKWLLPTWRGLPAVDFGSALEQPSQRAFWAKLAPFAAWVWLTNFMTNLFEIIDRYMIVHFSGFSNDDALIQVGHYHSSRILPVLFIAFSGMLASLILPHLARDWEAGRRGKVSDQMILAVKLCALVLSAGATAIVLIAPWLFAVAFAGKYDGGLAVLPWTLAYCVWFGLVTLAETYLWCAERVRLGTAALVVGIVVNIVLNLLLLPHFGLLGAVLATAASKLLVLVIVFWFGHALGLRWDWRMWATTLLPLAVCLGPVTALAIMMVVGYALFATDLVLTADEKKLLSVTGGPWVSKARAYVSGA